MADVFAALGWIGLVIKRYFRDLLGDHSRATTT